MQLEPSVGPCGQKAVAHIHGPKLYAWFELVRKAVAGTSRTHYADAPHTVPLVKGFAENQTAF